MPLLDIPPIHAAQPGGETQVLAFPASVAQQMFWYLELLQGTVTAFNIPLRFRLEGPLDVRLFERALNALIARHEVLRTCFREEDGELLQIVSAEITLRLPVLDISHFPADRLADESDRLGSLEAHRPFDLAKASLLRAEILRLGPEHHLFHFTVHHALFDGMSMAIFGRELAEFYQAFHDSREPRLEPLAIQYGDYSVWQKDFLASPRVKDQLGYWKKKLAGMKEVNLPTDFPRPPHKSWKGDITSILLPKELSAKLQTLAASHGATLFHVHLAAFLLLLHRYSGDLDIAVGASVAGRSEGDLEALIGVFINTLILRADLTGNPRFSEFLPQIRDLSLAALENQQLPFERLVHELRPSRDPGRNPLFQVNFNHYRSFTQTEHFGGVSMTNLPSRSPGAIFDLHLFLVEREEGWRASLDFSTDLFTRATADRMLGHLRTLLEDIAAHPDKTIGVLEILAPGERERTAGPWEFIGRKNLSAQSLETLAAPTPTRPAAAPKLPDGPVIFRLTALWEELLGISGIGPDDDFFALGGHSLMTLRMFSRIHREFGKSLPLATLLSHPTPALLAAQIEEPSAETPMVAPPPAPARSSITTLTAGEGGKPLFCIHGGDGGVLFYRGLANRMPREIPFHAIESLELGNSGRIDRTTIEETATRYLQDILQLQGHGPFRLAGYSFGGVVALEVACQLTDLGHRVEFLGLFDTDNPTAPVRLYGLAERLRIFWRRHRDTKVGARLGLLRGRILDGIRTNRRVRAELREARLSGPAEAYSDLRRVQVREENWRAMQTYQPRRFAGRITLFKSSHVSDKSARLDDYGWSAVAQSGLEIVPVEGEHLALFSAENVANLARELTRLLAPGQLDA